MKRHWPIVALSVVALATIDVAHASAKQRHHGAHHGVRHALGSVAPASSFGPARMYEARPGVWISTYTALPTRVTAGGVRAAPAAARPGGDG